MAREPMTSKLITASTSRLVTYLSIRKASLSIDFPCYMSDDRMVTSLVDRRHQWDYSTPHPIRMIETIQIVNRKHWQIVTTG
jgi:hypothetical protein